MFLQIVFRQIIETQNITDGNGFWWDFIKDFTLPIVLALLAIWMAYKIFIEETRRDKAIDDTRKTQVQSDKLFFFSALIDSVLRTSTEQKENIKSQIRAIRSDNTTFHLMKQVPLYDLKRITEVLDLEDYILAYSNIYHDDRSASIKEFKNIIATTDFLYEVFQQKMDQLQRSQIYDYEKKIKFSDSFDNSRKILSKLLINYEQKAFQSYVELSEIYRRFSEGHSGNHYDLRYYASDFFIPFDRYCHYYLGKGVLVDEDMLAFSSCIGDGLQIFEQIKSEQDKLKESLIADFKKIVNSLINLRKFSKKLLFFFENGQSRPFS